MIYVNEIKLFILLTIFRHCFKMLYPDRGKIVLLWGCGGYLFFLAPSKYSIEESHDRGCLTVSNKSFLCLNEFATWYPCDSHMITLLRHSSLFITPYFMTEMSKILLQQTVYISWTLSKSCLLAAQILLLSSHRLLLWALSCCTYVQQNCTYQINTRKYISIY